MMPQGLEPVGSSPEAFAELIREDTKQWAKVIELANIEPNRARDEGSKEEEMKLLSGFTVLDLGTFITAPYAAMLLAELGADVIKVERPNGGDPFRWFAGGAVEPALSRRTIGTSAASRWTYDMPRGPRAAPFVGRACRRAGDQCPARRREASGASMKHTLRRLNPKLVFCFITGFGADGPYAKPAAYDNVGQARRGLAGSLSRNRPMPASPARRSPTPRPASSPAWASSAALLERSRTGVGRKVEVNMLEATLALAIEPLAHYFRPGRSSRFIFAERCRRPIS